MFYSKAGVLKSIAVQALKEREEVCGQFIALHQHPDPASTHKQHLLLRRTHKLGRDAQRAQETAAEVEAKAASRGVRGGCGGESPAAAEEMTKAAPATTVTPARAASPAAATGAAPAAAPDGPGAMEDGEQKLYGYGGAAEISLSGPRLPRFQNYLPWVILLVLLFILA